MTINLTKPMREWVAEQAEARGFKNEQAYVQQLIKEEKKRLALQKLIKKLEASVASGYIEVTDAMWEDSKRKVKELYEARKKRGNVR